MKENNLKFKHDPLPQMPMPVSVQPQYNDNYNQRQNWDINTRNYPARTDDSSSEDSVYGPSTPNNITVSSPFSSRSGQPQNYEDDHRGIAGDKRETYTIWNHRQIADWILELYDGRFRKYENVLRQSLRKCNLKGRSLKLVNNMDIQDWGINDFEDMKMLQYYITELINSEKHLENMTIEGNGQINMNSNV